MIESPSEETKSGVSASDGEIGEEAKSYYGFWIYLSIGEINEIFHDERVKEIRFAKKDLMIYY